MWTGRCTSFEYRRVVGAGLVDGGRGLALREFGLATGGLDALPLDAVSVRSQLGQRGRDDGVSGTELF